MTEPVRKQPRRHTVAGTVSTAVLLAVFVLVVAPLRTARAEDKDQVPLPIKLPKAAFAGTPKEPPAESKDVEPLSPKPRPIPMVAKGTVNLALKKPVKASTKDTFNGTLDQITDGDKEAREGSCVELKPRLQWVQIDLGAAAPLSYVCVWHFHQEPVIFHDVVVQVSNDPTFEDGVTTLYNNDKDNSAGFGVGKDREYWETCEGRLIAAKGVKARYVRLYSKGSTYGDPLNRYTEVEVYGVPSK